MNTESILADFRSRDEFGQLLNRLDLMGEGVEIGVFEGDYALTLLQTWRGELLHLIDPWKPMDDYHDAMNASLKICEQRRQKTILRLSLFAARYTIHRKKSHEAVLDFDDQSLDFVYIDANHDYEHAREDINLWYPKLRPGGLMAGHDYCNEVTDWYDCGVKLAVDEFIHENKRHLHLTDDGAVSWFFLI